MWLKTNYFRGLINWLDCWHMALQGLLMERTNLDF